MRRRRQKNPLLMRILGISVLLHLLLLPVLAHYGAFKKIQQQFVETRLVVLPAPEQEKPKAEVKKEPKAAKKVAAVRKSTATTPHQHQAAQKSNLNQPKVVASAASGGSGNADGGPTVDANGTGKVGELPTQKANTTPPSVKQEETPVPMKKPEPPKTEPEKVVKNETPVPKVPLPTDVKPAVKRDPVYVDAEAIEAPQPTIPDDLRAEALQATFVAEFVVGMDGKPGEVKVAQSTGSDALDKLALQTARRWKFKPATRDGQPVESRVRLHIEFQVSE